MPKEFAVAIERAIDPKSEEKPLEFTFGDDPDTTLRIYKPDETQVMMLLSIAEGLTDEFEQVATFINLFVGMLDPDSSKHVRRRLLNRRDPLTVQDLPPVVFWLVEELGGRPTESPSDSSPSPPKNGQRSTGRARRTTSTRSSSPSTGSSTSSTASSSKEAPTGKTSTDS